MTTDNSAFKSGDEVKVMDAQHPNAGCFGTVKSVTGKTVNVEITLPDSSAKTEKFVAEQLSGIDDLDEEGELRQGLGIYKPEPEKDSPPNPLG